MMMMIGSSSSSSSSSSSKTTDQILSRYRPIAPKPPLLEGPPTPENTQQSPFFLTKPSRNRKRGAKSTYLPSSKRAKTGGATTSTTAGLSLSLQTLHAHVHGFPSPQHLNLVTLPFLPYPSSVTQDLLQNLHATNVIAPQPLRPIGSSISLQTIHHHSPSPTTITTTTKKPEEVEEEIEKENLPAVVSDSNNRIRLANSAYMEMVGQPECLWLKGECKRIGGKVMLDLSDTRLPEKADGFTCKVKIDWGSNEENRNSINVHCDVVKLDCKSKDYLFTWRFHTREISNKSK